MASTYLKQFTQDLPAMFERARQAGASIEQDELQFSRAASLIHLREVQKLEVVEGTCGRAHDECRDKKA